MVLALKACGKVFRRKTINAAFLDTQLKRCLNTFDITLLGIGHMIGAGIYVLTGSVARYTAGPGIVLSFLLAGFASLLSALCYAEFGARVPKAGSAYTYSYVTVGEIWAFVIGWNIILEHMLGAAAVARSWSGYLDSLFGHFIRNETLTYVGPLGGDILGDYPDFIAFLVIVVVCCFMGIGSKTSTNFNSIFTFINLGIIGFIIALGLTYANLDNWTLPSLGGFLPYGFPGVIAGAASCFFAYIGFDGIATSGEEAANPAKSIPIATIVSMTIVTICYCLMSSAFTLMIPYDHIHPSAAFADAFDSLGLSWAKYIVAVGALSGMTTSLVGSLFALPRCVYSMANDGLIFKCLAQIHPRTQVPTLAVVVFGLFTSIIALLFDIETLVEFLSIGTLMAYTIVSSSVIILRYRPSAKDGESEPTDITLALRGTQPKSVVNADDSWQTDETVESHIIDDQMGLVEADPAGKLRPFFRNILICDRLLGSFEPGDVVNGMVGLLIVFLLCFGITINYGHLWNGQWWIILITTAFGCLSFLCFLVINMFQPSTQRLRFKVPFVPFLPTLSIVINVVLMMHLAPITWLRLVIWLTVGFLIYFLYGMHHSTEGLPPTEYSSLINLPPGSGHMTPLQETPQPLPQAS